eukprot:6193205-Pleurochrysis_carterae.AAC.1
MPLQWYAQSESDDDDLLPPPPPPPLISAPHSALIYAQSPGARSRQARQAESIASCGSCRSGHSLASRSTAFFFGGGDGVSPFDTAKAKVAAFMEKNGLLTERTKAQAKQVWKELKPHAVCARARLPLLGAQQSAC